MTHAAGNSGLFSPLKIGSVTLQNRIVISPMCQYSAQHGCANGWHQAHLGSLAMSGAGLLFVEATAVSADGRITPGCLGNYSQSSREALADTVRRVREVSAMPLALQIGHAGRKASSAVPWQGGQLLAASAGGWQTVAPSAIAQHRGETPPQAMSQGQIDALKDAFAASARHALEAGFELLELHFAHGYLIHQFLSPVANARDDQYGGSDANRMRLALEVFARVFAEVGEQMPIGVRLSATDWVAGGWDIEDSVALCIALEKLGCSFFDVSSGGVSSKQQIPLSAGYQVHLAKAVRAAVDQPVIAVGLITDPVHANEIIRTGDADLVALARGFLHDPRWPWRAAEALGATVQAPAQYLRCLPHGAAPVFGETNIGQR